MDTSALISSIGGVFELARLAVDERDRQKASAIKADLTDKVIQAQSQLSQVMAAIIEKDATIHALSERVRNLEAEQSEKLRYQLREVGPGGHALAYQLRPAAELSERQDEPTHFLCQACLDVRKQKSMLQTVRRPHSLVCPSCDNRIALGIAG